jgi:hypothetical protein
LLQSAPICFGTFLVCFRSSSCLVVSGPIWSGPHQGCLAIPGWADPGTAPLTVERGSGQVRQGKTGRFSGNLPHFGGTVSSERVTLRRAGQRAGDTGRNWSSGPRGFHRLVVVRGPDGTGKSSRRVPSLGSGARITRPTNSSRTSRRSGTPKRGSCARATRSCRQWTPATTTWSPTSRSTRPADTGCTAW